MKLQALPFSASSTENDLEQGSTSSSFCALIRCSLVRRSLLTYINVGLRTGLQREIGPFVRALLFSLKQLWCTFHPFVVIALPFSASSTENDLEQGSTSSSFCALIRCSLVRRSLLTYINVGLRTGPSLIDLWSLSLWSNTIQSNTQNLCLSPLMLENSLPLSGNTSDGHMCYYRG
jgi:hypothetical protein